MLQMAASSWCFYPMALVREVSSPRDTGTPWGASGQAYGSSASLRPFG